MRRLAQAIPAVTLAGCLSSGIDLALHVVERYYGRAIAQGTADYMEEYTGELGKNPQYGKEVAAGIDQRGRTQWTG